MNRAVYELASGGLAALARLDAVTQNVANVNTAGYKASRPVFRLRGLDVPDPDLIEPPKLRVAAQVITAETVRDFTQGAIHGTGNPLDVAISGQGFLAVATPRGERYTRQGTLGLDGEGFLVTEHGERVQDDQGKDIRIGVGDVAIGTDGGIAVDGAPVAKLKLVGFGEHPALTPEGAALFAPVRGTVPQPVDARTRVEQGAVEQANVDAVAGMIELIEVARGFEQYTHAMQRLDEVSQKSINDVGRV
jgi:flagellar basal-body rod protein FlgF